MSRITKAPALAPAFFLLLNLPSPALAQVALDSPAAVAWHGPTRSWFVSNSGRLPAEDRASGWIARLDAGDKKADPYWVKGLRTPRGIAAVGDRLYAADGTEVVVLGIGTRAIEKKITVPESRLLNGVAVDAQGAVYVSDTLGNAVYRVAPDATVEVFVRSSRLQGPTALAVQDATLIVATWGAITNAGTWATRTPGGLLRIDLRSKAITSIGDGPIGNLDGLVVSGGGYLVTDRHAGKLLRISPAGEAVLVRDRLRGPGGIALESRQRVLAVPERDAKNVLFLTIN